MFKIRGTVASQTKQLEAHCDFKLKKPKAASGILMIRQNSFHEIPSLLCLDFILISLLHQTNTNIPPTYIFILSSQKTVTLFDKGNTRSQFASFCTYLRLIQLSD